MPFKEHEITYLCDNVDGGRCFVASTGKSNYFMKLDKRVLYTGRIGSGQFVVSADEEDETFEDYKTYKWTF